jgi:hypothetical protein
MLEVDVGTIPGGSQASTTAQWCHLPPNSKPGLWLESQIWANNCGGNSMVMDPSAHPQHMNIVKRLVHA